MRLIESNFGSELEIGSVREKRPRSLGEATTRRLCLCLLVAACASACGRRVVLGTVVGHSQDAAATTPSSFVSSPASTAVGADSDAGLDLDGGSSADHESDDESDDEHDGQGEPSDDDTDESEQSGEDGTETREAHESEDHDEPVEVEDEAELEFSVQAPSE